MIPIVFRVFWSLEPHTVHEACFYFSAQEMSTKFSPVSTTDIILPIQYNSSVSNVIPHSTYVPDFLLEGLTLKYLFFPSFAPVSSPICICSEPCSLEYIKLSVLLLTMLNTVQQCSTLSICFIYVFSSM